MRAYIVRRLLLIIPTLLVVTIIIFFMARLIPGSVIDIMVSRQEVTSAMLTREDIQRSLGLDVPLHVQYGRWLGVLSTPDKGFSGVLEGDLGTSIWKKSPVLEDILKRIPVSLELAIIALLAGQIIALPVGVISAIRQDTAADYITRTLAIAFIALPSFWLGTIVLVFPSIWWGWSPPVEYYSFFENPGQNIQMFIVPGVILGLVTSGVTMRMTRTMMLEVLRQDYIRTAWSKGVTERIVIIRHALKNAIIPVVTIIGLQLPMLIGGSIVTEQIFSIPGIGRLLLEVINSRDYTVISGINLFMATIVLALNLVVDVTYAYLDPRVHYR